jgi:hypothetical protein
VLNANPSFHARVFWYAADRQQHIAWKKLRVVRHAIKSFLPQLQGRNVFLRENNNAVVTTHTKLTSRSPIMITELRRM